MPGANEKSATPLFVLHEHASSVLCCSFYPSQSYQREQSSWFLSGDVDGTAILWNLITRRPLASVSVVEEARRQLLESAQQRRRSGEKRNADAGTFAESTAAQDVDFSALGPHSRSVLGVGFIPTTVAYAEAKEIAAVRGKGDLSTDLVHSQPPERKEENDSFDPTSAVAPKALKGTVEGPLRQRFRLPRRSLSHASAATQSSPATEFSSDNTPLLNTCFYTHCRDQRVYIWSLSQPSTSATSAALSLRLVAALTAPQHGFCPVESIPTVVEGLPRTYLAVPHDSQGEITIWELKWGREDKHEHCNAVEHGRVVESGGLADAGSPSVASHSEEDSDDTGEVDTKGMNPMDALIARAAAQERREEKRRQRQGKGGSCITLDLEGDDDHQQQPTKAMHPTAGKVTLNARKASFLCFVAPSATTAARGFSIRRLCSFSACPRFKGGIIMRLGMCSDAQHLTVAFESGHVVLARFRASTGQHTPGGAADSGAEEPSFSYNSAKPVTRRAVDSFVHVRCAVRAFAESALACWWSGQRVLACSAEGSLHCYEVKAVPHGGVAGESPTKSIDAALELQLLWSVTLRKGIGSVCMQVNLIIAGCWDSTLRLYDARDGRLVSILSYQKETINEVRMAPPAIARVAAFGFDARQPRCYAPPPLPPQVARPAIAELQGGLCHSTSSAIRGDKNTSNSAVSCLSVIKSVISTQSQRDGEEELVYLFGSASKDGSVALWRIDMQLLAERAALRIMSA
jgi:WD40 repeat protein